MHRPHLFIKPIPGIFILVTELARISIYLWLIPWTIGNDNAHVSCPFQQTVVMSACRRDSGPVKDWKRPIQSELAPVGDCCMDDAF